MRSAAQRPRCDQYVASLSVLDVSDEYTVSRRGVVFLRDQDLTPQLMLEFGEKLTAIAGCVSSFPVLDDSCFKASENCYSD